MAFRWTTFRNDFALLFVTRILRMFSYGMLSVIFFENLFFKGVTEIEATLLQSVTIAVDIVISLILTSKADRIGRLNTLMLGAVLKLITGLVYAESENLTLLFVTGIFGVLSVTGGEIGPFMAIEQSALSQLIEKCTDDAAQIQKNTSTAMKLYTFLGYIGQGLGCLFAGIFFLSKSQSFGNQYYAIVNILHIYAVIGGIMFICYYCMNSDSIESQCSTEQIHIHSSIIQYQNSKPTINVVLLMFLMLMDGMAAAFLTNTYIAFFFQEKFDYKNYVEIGIYLLFINILRGSGDFLSHKLTNRIGTIKSMLLLYLSSSALLIILPITKNFAVTITIFFTFYAFSKIDRPAKQELISKIVSPSQKLAANKIANIARALGICISTGIAGIFIRTDPSQILFSIPFFISSGIRIIYSVAISSFINHYSKKEKANSQFERLQLSEGYLEEQKEIKI